MAFNLLTRYPGRANAADSNYPQGSFKNRSAPGTLDGSYLERDWANDHFAFLQALILRAGITINGNVDNATNSQYYTALRSLTTTPVWSNTVNYTAPFMVFGSDGQLYIALLASGPGTTPRDPISQPTYWRTLASFLGVTAASETVAGIAESATQAETDAGTAGNFTVTPAKLRNGFAISLAANGYVKFPTWLSGLIIQWGTSSNINQGASQLINFPLAHPNAILRIVVGSQSNVGANTNNYSVSGSPGSATQFVIYNNSATSGVAQGVWISIGH